MTAVWRKQEHYFIVRLSQDLFGDWVVIRSWGNLNNNLGGCKQDVISCQQKALSLFDSISQRQLKRGYSPSIPPTQYSKLNTSALNTSYQNTTI
ncbi:MAG: WGR domain-containing protein [Motiliproteus sp.]